MKPIFLKIYRSGKLLTSRQFTADQVSVGSSEDGPSLVLKDPSVYSWHVLIEKRGEGQYHISDLGSPTGTFVNSKQVVDSPLKHGDQIKIGDFTIQFFIHVPFLKPGASPVKTTPPVEEKPVAPAEPVVAPAEPVAPAKPVTPAKPATPPKPVEPAVEKPKVKTSKKLTKGEALEKLDIPDEFVLHPLKKKLKKDPVKEPIKKLKKEPVKKEEDPVGVSALKQTEIIPPKPSFDGDIPSDPTIDKKTQGVQVFPPSPSEEGAFYNTQNTLDIKPTPESAGTYAPASAVKDLDTYIPVGSGPIVEVLIAWKERILSIHHFTGKKNQVLFGSDPKADIHCPNFTGNTSYNLLSIGQKTLIHLSDSLKVSVRDYKGGKLSSEELAEKGMIGSKGSQKVIALNQSQLVRLDFSPSLRVYVRHANKSPKAIPAGVFNFSFSEMMGLMMSFFFMSILFFYLAFFSPQTLDPSENLEEDVIKKATMEFKKKRRVVKLKVAKKKQKTKLSIPHKKKVPKKTKRVGIKKKGKAGRIGQVAAKPKAKTKKKAITSARPGGSVTTKKSGAGPKSPRPDPTKIGLLGVFGQKGVQKELDKTYSGAGDLAGLAEQATGSAGQKESYAGEGIGTQFKDTGAGGKGSNLIGVSGGIKTKGRGGGARGYGAGGSLGQRGRVQLSLGTSDWEVEGGVDKDAILRVIRRNKNQLERCYEIALQKKPDLEGKVLVKWDIVNERVRRAKVKNNTTADAVLARCILSRLQNFRFTGTGLKKGQVGEVSIPFVVTKK